MSQMIACPSCHCPIKDMESLPAKITAEVRSNNGSAASRQQAETSEVRRKFDAEKDESIPGLSAKIEDLQGKVEQGSQKLQGEVPESPLRDVSTVIGVPVQGVIVSMFSN